MTVVQRQRSIILHIRSCVYLVTLQPAVVVYYVCIPDGINTFESLLDNMIFDRCRRMRARNNKRRRTRPTW